MARLLLSVPRMSQVMSHFALRVEQVDGFEFRVRFDKDQYPELHTDEPAPLGKDVAPNPARILAAAIGDCLTASLLFCLKRAGAPPEGISADVDVEIVRNENKRLRIGHIDVKLKPKLAADHPALVSCLTTFQDFCVVTESVRAGLDVRVTVEPT